MPLPPIKERAQRQDWRAWQNNTPHDREANQRKLSDMAAAASRERVKAVEKLKHAEWKAKSFRADAKRYPSHLNKLASAKAAKELRAARKAASDAKMAERAAERARNNYGKAVRKLDRIARQKNKPKPVKTLTETWPWS